MPDSGSIHGSLSSSVTSSGGHSDGISHSISNNLPYGFAHVCSDGLAHVLTYFGSDGDSLGPAVRASFQAAQSL